MERNAAAGIAGKGTVVAAVAAGYYLLARTGLALALPGTSSSAVWPASGLAVGAVLLHGPAAAAGVLLGSWLANALNLAASGAGAWKALLVAGVVGAGSALQALAAAALFRRFLSPESRFLNKARDVALFAALTPLACVIAASAGNAALATASLIARPALALSWLTWWVGDALGVMIVTPMMLAWSPAARRAEPLTPARSAEAAVALALIALSAWAGFGDEFRTAPGHYPLSHVCVPLLIWTTMRLGARGVTAGAAVLTVLAQWRALEGQGPFAGGSPSEAVLFTSIYVAGATLTAYLLRAVMAELHEAEASLRRRVSERDNDLWTANATLRVAALERKQDHHRIRLYRKLVEKLPIGVAVVRIETPENPAGWKIVELNPAGRRLSAAADADEGKPLFDFAPEIAGTDLPRVCLEVLRTGQERSIPDYTSPRRLPGAHFSLGVFPLGDELVGIAFEETTVQRAAQESLRRGEEQMRHMIESVQDYAIFRLDPDGRIVSWNKGAQKITGYAADEILGLPYGVLFRPDEARSGAPQALLKEAAETGRAEAEGWRVRKDGNEFWTNSVLTALRDDLGRQQGYVKVLRDVTEKRLVERALQEKSAALARSNVELTQFAYVASHDLQEPLRKVAAFAELLRERLAPKLDVTDVDFMNRLMKAVEGMQGLIDALLKLARVNTAETALKPVDLTALAAQVAEELDVALSESGGKIHVEPLPTVEADPHQMHQLLQNLLANAIKFRAPGKPPTIRVRGRILPDGRAEFSVSDDGVGFDMRYAARLFQPFQRLHSRKDYQGTGMGLAICQKIVSRHGGALAAESAVGRGTTFTVVLPAAQQRKKDAPETVGGGSWNKE